MSDVKTVQIAIRVSPEQKAKIEKAAAIERRSMSDYVRLVVEDHVQKTLADKIAII